MGTRSPRRRLHSPSSEICLEIESILNEMLSLEPLGGFLVTNEKPFFLFFLLPSSRGPSWTQRTRHTIARLRSRDDRVLRASRASQSHFLLAGLSARRAFRHLHVQLGPARSADWLHNSPLGASPSSSADATFAAFAQLNGQNPESKSQTHVSRAQHCNTRSNSRCVGHGDSHTMDEMGSRAPSVVRRSCSVEEIAS